MMLFARGLIIALAFGVPVGAVGVLCLQRTLSRGFLAGFVTGLGSTAADVLYATAGIFAASLVSRFLDRCGFAIRCMGSALIFAYGALTLMKALRNKTQPEIQAETSALNLCSYFLLSLSVALLNPAAFLSFLVVFSTLNIHAERLMDALALVGGIFCGTTLWWLLLSGAAHLLRKKMSYQIFRVLTIICGVLMMGFGVGCLLVFPAR